MVERLLRAQRLHQARRVIPSFTKRFNATDSRHSRLDGVLDRGSIIHRIENNDTDNTLPLNSSGLGQNTKARHHALQVSPASWSRLNNGPAIHKYLADGYQTGYLEQGSGTSTSWGEHGIELNFRTFTPDYRPTTFA